MQIFRTFWRFYSELFEKCLFYVKNLRFSRIFLRKLILFSIFAVFFILEGRLPQ